MPQRKSGHDLEEPGMQMQKVVQKKPNQYFNMQAQFPFHLHMSPWRE